MVMRNASTTVAKNKTGTFLAKFVISWKTEYRTGIELVFECCLPLSVYGTDQLHILLEVSTHVKWCGAASALTPDASLVDTANKVVMAPKAFQIPRHGSRIETRLHCKAAG
jgi:hypothetical protein